MIMMMMTMTTMEKKYPEVISQYLPKHDHVIGNISERKRIQNHTYSPELYNNTGKFRLFCCVLNLHTRLIEAETICFQIYNWLWNTNSSFKKQRVGHTHNQWSPTALKWTCLAVSQTGSAVWGLDRSRESRIHICVFKSSSRHIPDTPKAWGTILDRRTSTRVGSHSLVITQRGLLDPKSVSRNVYILYIFRLDVFQNHSFIPFALIKKNMCEPLRRNPVCFFLFSLSFCHSIYFSQNH